MSHGLPTELKYTTKPDWFPKNENADKSRNKIETKRNHEVCY